MFCCYADRIAFVMDGTYFLSVFVVQPCEVDFSNKRALPYAAWIGVYTAQCRRWRIEACWAGRAVLCEFGKPSIVPQRLGRREKNMPRRQDAGGACRCCVAGKVLREAYRLETGRLKRNSRPPLRPERTVIVPLWRLMMLRTMESPSPEPPESRVRPSSTR